jgi:Mn-dependent DtxR family transcriptional regulator
MGDLIMTKIDDLDERMCEVLVAFRRLQNGRGTRNDVRKAAGVGRGLGTPLVNKLMKQGLLEKIQFDDYRLTQEGFAVANDLIERKH